MDEETETLELEPGETLTIETAEPTPEPEPELTADNVAVVALVAAAENAVETEHLAEDVAEVEETVRTTEERLEWLERETIPHLMREISDLRNRLELLTPLEPLAEAITEAEETPMETPAETTEPLTPNDTSESISETPTEAIAESEQSEPAEIVAVVEPPRRRWI